MRYIDDLDIIGGGVWSRPGFLVRRLHQIHCALFYEESKYGITPVQYGIMTVLARNPWLDQTAVGYEVGLDRTTVADVIRRLEDKGWVERRTNEQDRRSRLVAITTEGLAVMLEMQAGVERSQRKLLAPLSLKDQRTFLTLLFQVVEANNQYGRATLKVS
ncbi:MarR family transcriptional regulator [Pusillimonas sp. CC-YST705]|uniref:MarR family transcriptional regulator n=1 Tax=Mesopusillimonas faecipullorum TaxID=2755040 RepID=A0ABS8CDW5_9BURK|nr:MarR family transcriptional regulator [Mesopusillimonas faecipullorum]MCB5364231.1 MarR family transcriptional regulator [Mesopusillimonas faecipullorum]